MSQLYGFSFVSILIWVYHICTNSAFYVFPYVLLKFFWMWRPYYKFHTSMAFILSGLPCIPLGDYSLRWLLCFFSFVFFSQLYFSFELTLMSIAMSLFDGSFINPSLCILSCFAFFLGMLYWKSQSFMASPFVWTLICLTRLFLREKTLLESQWLLLCMYSHVLYQRTFHREGLAANLTAEQLLLCMYVHVIY